MIAGVGTDVIEVARVQKALERESFGKKVYTQAEWEYIVERGVPAQSAAGMFCAKEAVLKTLGLGITDAPLRDIEVLHHASGAPYIALHGKLARMAGGTFHLSITHTKDYASAFAVLEREG